MGTRIFVSLLFFLLSLASFQSEAAASPLFTFAFGYSYNDNMENLILQGPGADTIGTNGYQGWVSAWSPFDNIGGPSGNMNYFVGTDWDGFFHNDYFIFDISRISLPITSATLQLTPFFVLNDVTYRVGAASNFVSSLIDAKSPDVALYNALASGTFYGQFDLSSANTYGPPILFPLNSAAVSDLNAAITNHDHYFAVGGTVTGVFDGVPEPTTWAMLLLGFGVIGITFRRQQTVHSNRPRIRNRGRDAHY